MINKDVAEYGSGRVRRLLWVGTALMQVATPLATAQRNIGRITGIELPVRVIGIDRATYMLRGNAVRLDSTRAVGRYVLFEYNGRNVQIIRILERESVD